MGLFNRTEPAKIVVQTGSVHINEGNKTPEQRIERAKGRVDTLTNKLKRLTDGRYNGTDPVILKATVEGTKKAISEWTKRLRLAEYEIELMKEDV